MHSICLHIFGCVQVRIKIKTFLFFFDFIKKTKFNQLGAWLSAVSADSSAVRVSLELCAIKILRRHISLTSMDLEPALALFNTTNQTQYFLQCDAENRAHSTEWLVYSHLQTGNWFRSLSALHDLIRAENLSNLTATHHYLAFAYRAQARSIVEMFFWFPYQTQFLNKIQLLSIFSEEQKLILFGDESDGWYPVWSEAGYRFGNIFSSFFFIRNHLLFHFS